MKIIRTLFLVSSFLYPSVAQSEEIRVLAWNVQSGGNDPEVIAQQLADFKGYDVIGLSEVHKSNVIKYVIGAASGEDAFFNHKTGKTGRSDRLLIIWDSKKFDKTAELEMDELKMGSGRAPLAVRLKSKANGTQFWFMVNQLYRGNKSNNKTKRKEQAIGLRTWIKDQTIPTIVVGSFYFDYKIPDGPGNSAYKEMVKGNSVKWVRPGTLVKTKANPKSNSVTDFVFVNDKANAWKPKSKIIVREGDFKDPDSSKLSDHRPVDAVFHTGSTLKSIRRPKRSSGRKALRNRNSKSNNIKDDIKKELQRLRKKIKDLESKIQEMNND